MYNKPVHAELRGINDISFPKLDFKKFNFFLENGRGFNIGQMEDFTLLELSGCGFPKLFFAFRWYLRAFALNFCDQVKKKILT